MSNVKKVFYLLLKDSDTSVNLNENDYKKILKKFNEYEGEKSDTNKKNNLGKQEISVPNLDTQNSEPYHFQIKDIEYLYGEKSGFTEPGI